MEAEEVEDARLGLVERLTRACAEEIDRLDPAVPMPWRDLPTVSAMTAHLGGVQRWATVVLRARRPVRERRVDPPERPGPWFEEGRQELLAVLRAVPPGTPCWTVGAASSTAAFWRRRMVFEHVKHLMDLRTAGGGTWAAAAELEPQDYADGVDELLEEFLPRSRPTLHRLPGAVLLEATDLDRRWRIDADWAWSADRGVGAPTAATLRAACGDLALVLWERADPLAEDARYAVLGDAAVVAALRDAPIHPW